MKLIAATLALLGAALALDSSRTEPRFYKGNTHTHTLWSDGDAAPEFVTAWYRERGYHFLVLSDHNVLQDREHWFPVSDRLTAQHVEALEAQFGAEAVRTREANGKRAMQLATITELRERFEKPGEFLLMPGEEITGTYRGTSGGERVPVHVNGLHLDAFVAPAAGDSPRAVMNAAFARVAEQEERTGRPMLAHLNHPNFQWAMTWEDLAAIEHYPFFELFNGHRGVGNHGDATRPSTETMWDRALVVRLESGRGVLYGVGTDDAHNYHGKPTARPGRAWIQVRAESLEPAQLIAAMRAGDFYVSTGVELEDFGRDEQRFWVDVDSEEGLTYTVRFLGKGGTVLAETSSDPAEYSFTGEELYVRAVVESSRAHPDPFAKGDPQMAWLQPVVPGR
ncbi:MAG: hypothetical protein GY711_10700 [bacterium]|nr:hypothetical protein [bacterium]